LYHGILPADSAGGDGTWQNKHVLVDDFREQMQYIAGHYHPIPLSELATYLSRGKTLPLDAVAVTFDDGYWNNFSVAFPLLRSLDIPATVFVVTDFVNTSLPLWPDRVEHAIAQFTKEKLALSFGREQVVFDTSSTEYRKSAATVIRQRLKRLPDDIRHDVVKRLEDLAGSRLQDTIVGDPVRGPASWEELRELTRDGLIEIGSHTATHAILTRCSEELARREAAASKLLIEECVSRPCRLFAYPNGRPGDFNAATHSSLSELGYEAAVTTVQGLVNRKTDLFEIPRLSLHSGIDISDFERRLSGWSPFVDHLNLLQRRLASQAFRRLRDIVKGRNTSGLL